jgi:hypothetical protein
MDTTRTVLATVIVVMALGAWGGGASAKEEPTLMAPASFTFTREPVDDTSNRHMPEVMRGHRDASTIEATDARVSGLLTETINGNWAVGDETGVLSAATSQRLTNDGGAWVGGGRMMLAYAGGSSRMAGMTVLAGEGGYAGLTLILSQAWDAAAVPLNWGIIVPTDQLPPMPDPIGPTDG